MALEKAFREARRLLKRLRDDLMMLRLSVREDAPVDGAVVLVDKMGDAVDDSLGSLEEALADLEDAGRASVPSLRRDAAARALSRCQEHFHLVELKFQAELVSYECLTDLAAFTKSRDGEWPAWMESVRQGLDQCKEPLNEANQALIACWQELAERDCASSETALANGLQGTSYAEKKATGVVAASGAA